MTYRALSRTSMVILIAAALVGCSSDYRKHLPNGYVLVRTNANTKAIFVPSGPDQKNPTHPVDGVAVAALIDRITVHGDLVLGQTVASPSSELRDFERVGFFILDTKSGGVQSGLSEQQWIHELSSLGIESNQLTLRSPDAWHPTP